MAFFNIIGNLCCQGQGKYIGFASGHSTFGGPADVTGNAYGFFTLTGAVFFHHSGTLTFYFNDATGQGVQVAGTADQYFDNMGTVYIEMDEGGFLPVCSTAGPFMGGVPWGTVEAGSCHSYIITGTWHNNGPNDLDYGGCSETGASFYSPLGIGSQPNLFCVGAGMGQLVATVV